MLQSPKRTRNLLCAHANIELLEFPYAHLSIFIFVKGIEHGSSLLLVQTKLWLQHTDGVLPVQVTNIVGYIPFEEIYNLFPGNNKHSMSLKKQILENEKYWFTIFSL